MSNDTKKRSKRDRISDEITWENVRKPVRQFFYELVHGFGVSLAFMLTLVAAGPLYALLVGGLAHTALGSVLSLGVGVFGNPIVTIAVTFIRLIDGDLNPEVSRVGFFIKGLLRAIASAAGAAFAGLLMRGLHGGLLSNSILPANILPGTLFATGFGVALVFLFENHVSVLSSIMTDDGYGMILALGLSQFAFGISSWIIWQTVPNINILFAVAVSVMEWNSIMSFTLLISLISAAATVGLYYLFLNDIFSQQAKQVQKAEALSDDVTVMLDNKGGVPEKW